MQYDKQSKTVTIRTVYMLDHVRSTIVAAQSTTLIESTHIEFVTVPVVCSVVCVFIIVCIAVRAKYVHSLIHLLNPLNPEDRVTGVRRS